MQRLENILAQKSAPKSARMAKLLQFLQGHPKPAFSEKGQRGDQGKFFKNRPKRCPRWKGPQALRRKWHYPLISMHLKCKDWKTFWRKKRLQRVPEWPSYGNFCKVTQKKKMGQKVALAWKAQKHTAANGIILSFVRINSANTGEIFGVNSGSKSARLAKLCQFWRDHSKPAFSEKVQRGTKGTFSKIAQKDALAKEGLKHSGANGIIL